MLILEGADLVGKTTLQAELLRHKAFSARGYMPAHAGPPPDGFDHCWGYIDLASRRVVQDRFHMSEFVYDRVLRGGQQLLDPETYRLIDGRLCDLGVFTVIITASESVIKGRYQVRRERLSLEQVLHANSEYLAIVGDGPKHEFRPNYDLHVNQPLGCKGITARESVSIVVERYFRRQMSLDYAMRRREARYDGLKLGFDAHPDCCRSSEGRCRD